MTFTIPGPPVPKARPRVNRSGHAWTPKATKDYERLVALYARKARAEHRWPFKEDGNVRVELVLWEDCVDVVVEPSELERFGSFDADNACKAILDGLERGEIYDNDRRVVDLRVAFGQEDG